MKRILVPLDGSALSEAVLPLAEALASDYEADVLLVRALQPQSSPEGEVRAQDEAEHYLAAVVNRLTARGLARVAWKVWYDDPARAVVDAARHNAADLIVMSTHGRGGLSRLLLGSVAESVVRSSPAPVLLVRGALTWTPGSIGRILVPLDGSEVSETILSFVEPLAGPFDFAIDLLRVVELPPPAVAVELGQARELGELTRFAVSEAKRYLPKVAAALEAKGLRVGWAVREGTAVEAIQRYAQERGVGLIAMTTHGRTGLGRLLLGSVAERVLRGAAVPVLLSKPPATV
jgi:nucleotide-binding universal stress UspA family protein